MRILPLEGNLIPSSWRTSPDFIPFSAYLDLYTGSGGIPIQGLHVRRTLSQSPFGTTLINSRLALTVFCAGREPVAAFLWKHVDPVALETPLFSPECAQAQIIGNLQALFDLAIDITPVEQLTRSVLQAEQRLNVEDTTEQRLIKELKNTRRDFQIAIITPGPLKTRADIEQRFSEEVSVLERQIVYVHTQKEIALRRWHLLEKAFERRAITPGERREVSQRIRWKRCSNTPPRP